MRSALRSSTPKHRGPVYGLPETRPTLRRFSSPAAGSPHDDRATLLTFAAGVPRHSTRSQVPPAPRTPESVSGAESSIRLRGTIRGISSPCAACSTWLRRTSSSRALSLSSPPCLQVDASSRELHPVSPRPAPELGVSPASCPGPLRGRGLPSTSRSSAGCRVFRVPSPAHASSSPTGFSPPGTLCDTMPKHRVTADRSSRHR